MLGTEGPKSSDPARYIRFIYNRIILENATVRAAAVSALAAFGAQVESLRSRIIMLLRRTLQDNDDEVRRSAPPSFSRCHSHTLEPAPLWPSALHAHVHTFCGCDVRSTHLHTCAWYCWRAPVSGSMTRAADRDDSVCECQLLCVNLAVC